MVHMEIILLTFLVVGLIVGKDRENENIYVTTVSVNLIFFVIIQTNFFFLVYKYYRIDLNLLSHTLKLILF